MSDRRRIGRKSSLTGDFSLETRISLRVKREKRGWKFLWITPWKNR